MNKDELLNIAKPMLFNTDMVRAILNGDKTQTRRLAKFDELGAARLTKDNPAFSPIEFAGFRVGDYIYVRETWHKDEYRYMYRADYSDSKKFYVNGKETTIKWSPSIHMPKTATRLFLRVTDVKLEHLHDMSFKDFMSEGIGIRPESYNDPDNAYYSAKKAFSQLWDSTIPAADLATHGYDANPKVWAYTFERVIVEEAEREAG